MEGNQARDLLRMGGLYALVRGVIGFLLRTLSRVEIEGLENLPKRGPFIIVANHLHWLDSPTLMVAMPFRAHVFAGEKWAKHWLIGPLLRSVSAIFVNRGEVDRKALRQALGILKGGGALGMAPEGTRSKTGALQQGRSGAAYLAYHGGAPLVPVVAYGEERLFWALRRLRRTRVHIIIGKPFGPPAMEGKVTMAQLDAFTEEIMYRLAGMLPASYRGVYADVTSRRPDLVAGYEAGKQLNSR